MPGLSHRSLKRWQWFVILLAIVSEASACAPAPAPEPGSERIIEIVAREYAFQAPDTVDPGKATLALRNEGAVLHEMILMKLNAGVTVKQVHDAYLRDESFRPFLDGGNAVLFAEAGDTGTGRISHDFTPGSDYVLWCNFRDNDGAPQHARLGMFKPIHVRAAPVVARSSVAGQLTIETGDYHFRAPDTVAAGVTELRMRNTGTQRHEVSLSLIKAGAQASFFFEQFLKGANVDSLYDDDGAILTAWPADENTSALRVDFLPGRTYVLVCEFKDTPTSPPHTSLGMFKAIEVSP